MENDKITPDAKRAYWRANLRLMSSLLLVWAGVSWGAGILFVDRLNAFSLSGFKLGFWVAQQGAIYVFLVLIIMYARSMNKLDRKFHVHED